MSVCFGMDTYIGGAVPDRTIPASTYSPDQLDVDQWVQIARDAGMKYAVLTVKHATGFCLWPSKYTEYTVASTSHKTDVVELFAKACQKHGVLPGLQYASWDNYHRFGAPPMHQTPLPKAYTTSFYQDFQTAQLTELLTEYGQIMEIWINNPRVLGRGYRAYLYSHLANLQPNCLIVMHNGVGDGTTYNIHQAWPSDIITMSRSLPPKTGHEKWRTIEGRRYYMPGEVVDTLGKEWFFVDSDSPRPDEELKNMLLGARKRGTNLLLAVQPNRRGRIPNNRQQALGRLRKNAGL